MELQNEMIENSTLVDVIDQKIAFCLLGVSSITNES